MSHIRSLNLMRFFLLLMIVLLANGCSKPMRKPEILSTNQNWSAHLAQIVAIKEWQTKGKLGIKVPNDGGNASIRWQQQQGEYQIDLAGPLGMGKMMINGYPDRVTLSKGDRLPQTAKTAEELLVKNMGWGIPVTQLAYWVRGLPAPKNKATHFKFNAQGLLSELEQEGWKVTYGDYLTVTDAQAQNVNLPGRIQAEYKDIQLTLILREWTLGAAP
jgi:outer membrane lipoprotein LolB